ncbi:MAG: ComF family protein [Chloroflexi bacterium]|nr:ComF family protein [Chloroflexota bacterium]
MTLPGTLNPPALAYRLYQWFWNSLDWLYPPQCAGCETIGYRWCQECQASSPRLPDKLCMSCGTPHKGVRVCEQCQLLPPNYDAVRSWAVFEDPLRKAIVRLKYKRDLGLGEVLARSLIGIMHKIEWQIDMVIPVPLGKTRLSERGYNQAAVLARPLALSLRLQYQPNALHRIRETISQVGLSFSERRENVAGAFEADRSVVAGKRILMVDDVMTTGATLDECAKALKLAGVKQVLGITLARVVE